MPALVRAVLLKFRLLIVKASSAWKALEAWARAKVPVVGLSLWMPHPETCRCRRRRRKLRLSDEVIPVADESELLVNWVVLLAVVMVPPCWLFRRTPPMPVAVPVAVWAVPS